MPMLHASKSVGLVCVAIVLGALTARAASQAPFVKTTYAVSPAKMTLWATMHEPLSDADIAKVNLELFAKGDKEAAYELGLAYMQGLGVPEDFIKAEKMFQIGAVSAEQKAMVGMFHAEGYFPKDLNAVERWYTAAGRPQDLFELAECFKAAADSDKSAASRYYPKAIAIYLSLLRETGHPEVRRAQLELGNLVLDGNYSAGSDAKARAQNLEWARIMAQEALGQKDYSIAVDYSIGQEDLPPDPAMWLRYCKRAAAYNIDLAQHFYVEALNEGRARDFTGYDAIAWTRLSSQKMYADLGLLKAMTQGLSKEQVAGANAAYETLLKTRAEYGAYYVQDDPLRNPSPAELAAMDQDDPDVQLREAFNLEKDAALDPETYQRVLAMYRTVRDQRDTQARFVLGRYALYGTNGVPKNLTAAKYWLVEAIRSGSKPAQELLDEIQKASAD